MARRYIITDERNAGQDEVTSKLKARKIIAQRNAEGIHFACYILDGDRRIDAGTLEALEKIKHTG